MPMIDDADYPLFVPGHLSLDEERRALAEIAEDMVFERLWRSLAKQKKTRSLNENN